jgi:CheY-like chemotaxis protein
MNELKILAVDDEINVLYCIADVLREFDVVYETSPVAAVQLVEEQHFDIIITDYSMPKVNGIELLGEAKEYSMNKYYIAILCSAHDTTYLFEGEKEKELFHFFLEKPFTTETLTKAVTRAAVLLKEVSAYEIL